MLIRQFMSCSLKKDSEAKETLSNEQHALSLSAAAGWVWGGKEVGRKKRGMERMGTGQLGQRSFSSSAAQNQVKPTGLLSTTLWL